jgi:ribosomal protein S18 acetylase RimI-like enzyme
MITRRARPEDATAIANLHVASWRRTYRGILRDEYLDGPVVTDRQKLWASRLSSPSAAEQAFVLVIEQERELAAFVCVLLDSDPEWGALLDNLHVAAERRGQRLGTRLMASAAAWVILQRPESRLHLWVYEKNLPARRFYEALGGKVVDRCKELAPDGARVDCVRYGWRTLSALTGAIGDAGADSPAR